MELSKLVNSVSVIQLTGEVERKDVESITYDSRRVKKNTLFVAVTGFNTDGHRYILEAINQGAMAVVVENNSAVPEEIFRHRNVTRILVKNSREALSQLSNAFYKRPADKLNMTGITGTKGKTTTSFFVKSILETAGRKTGLVGTIANYIGQERIYTNMTTPESSDLFALFADMAAQQCTDCVMEVSSHSLVLKRVANVPFKTAIFTNLTSDHLDFHKTREEYLKAKKILFDSLSGDAAAIYNADDPASAVLLADTAAGKYSYGQSEDCDFRLENIYYDLNGTRFDLRYNGAVYNISTRLIGLFNAYNAASAFAAAVISGIDIKTAIEGIANTPQVPGRFETIHNGERKIIVDYSHTADSLEQALLAIKNITKGERPVYTVFGCGGNRDKTKRPEMGRIACRHSTKVFITSDNPRNEEPLDIISDIVNGLNTDNFTVIENRKEAIETAIVNSESNAVILIAGKGHETYQEIKGVRHHFSDKEIAENIISR